MTDDEPTIGEVYDYALEHGPVVMDGWRITAWPDEPTPSRSPSTESETPA